LTSIGLTLDLDLDLGLLVVVDGTPWLSWSSWTPTPRGGPGPAPRFGRQAVRL